MQANGLVPPLEHEREVAAIPSEAEKAAEGAPDLLEAEEIIRLELPHASKFLSRPIRPTSP